jgi:hypothetical protein
MTLSVIPEIISVDDHVGNALFETDYPHADGTRPYSKDTARQLFGHLQVKKIAQHNAIDLLGLGFERTQ